MTTAATSNTPWPTVKLGDVCEFIGGGTPSKSHPEYYDGDIPWATVRDMNCKVIEKTERSITEEGVSKSATNIIKAGQLVISTHVGLGKVCYLAKDTAINQDLKAVIPISDELCVDFLYVYFLTMADFILSKGTGSTVKGVKLDFVKNLPIPLPPLEVQREIVAKVEKGLAEADGLAAHFKRLAALADETFKAELDETFQSLSAPTVKLGDVCEIVSARRVHKSDWKSTGIPFYRAREIVKLADFGYVNNQLFISEELYNRYKNMNSVPQVNDLMVSAVGTVGRVYVVKDGDKFYYKDASVLCLKNRTKMNPWYIKYYIESPSFRDIIHEESKGATVDTITIERANDYPIPLPPLDEQQAIVAKLEAVKAKCERLKVEAERGVKAAEALRKAVLAEAFEQ